MPLDTSDDVHFWPVSEPRRRGEVQVEDDSAGGRGAPQPPGHPHPHALWPLRAPLQESNQNSLLQRTVLLGLWHKVKAIFKDQPALVASKRLLNIRYVTKSRKCWACPSIVATTKELLQVIILSQPCHDHGLDHNGIFSAFRLTRGNPPSFPARHQGASGSGRILKTLLNKKLNNK